jgi:signal transduction histidine kinase
MVTSPRAARMRRVSRARRESVPPGPGHQRLVPGWPSEDTATVTCKGPRSLAVGCAAGAAAVSAAGLALAAGIPGYFPAYVAGHLLVNATIGIAYALIGGCIAWTRPRNAIGWLFILQGWCGGGLTAVGEPYGLLAIRGNHLPLAAWVAWIGGWSWSVAFLLGPTVLLTLWPSGRAAGRLRLLVTASAAVVIAVTTVVALSPNAMPADVSRLGQPLVWRPIEALAPVAFPLILACVIACVAAAVWRLLRADSPEREQLGWYLVVSAAFFACSVWLSPEAGAVVQPLLILALGWALLWYGLVDLRLVLRRTLVYGVLTGCVAAIYAVVTAILSGHIRSGPLPALAAAAVVSVGLIPFRDALQRGASRLVYGERRDPALAVARVGEGLQRLGEGLLPAVAAAVAEAVRSPYVAIEDGGGRLLAAHGDAKTGGLRHAELLHHQGVAQGRLVVVPRTRGEPLDRADLQVVRVLAPHVALAARAAALTAELDRSRGQVIAASLAERERLRRDLHDGMGPSLGGLALGLAAAETLLDTDPATTRQILARTRDEADRAVTEIRRIIDDLRPDVLDQSGLAGALRDYAQLVSARQSLTVDLDTEGFDGPPGAPLMAPSVEVAAYRIAQEAITNVVRHSGASRCAVRLTCHDAVGIEISDNGGGISAIRADGLGLASIRQRAQSCGGTLSISTSAAGTHLTVTLPREPPS